MFKSKNTSSMRLLLRGTVAGDVYFSGFRQQQWSKQMEHQSQLCALWERGGGVSSRAPLCLYRQTQINGVGKYVTSYVWEGWGE